MISEEQMIEMAPHIAKMMETPGWRCYVQLIAEKIAITQQLAIDDDPSKLLEHRGAIYGMRAAVASAEDILNTARQATGEKREARRQSIAARVSPSTFE